MRLKIMLMLMCLTVSMIPVGIIGGFQGFELATAFLGLILVITLIVSMLMTQFISRPLEKLTKNINEISKGNLDVKLDQSEIYEINVLTQSLERVMTSLKLAIQKIGVKKANFFQEAIQAKTQTEEKYKDFLQILDGWIWQTDAKGILIDCSKNIENILYYKPEDVLTKPLYQFVDSNELKQIHTAFKKASKNPAQILSQNTHFIDKKGKKVSIFMSWKALFDENNTVLGYRGISLKTQGHTNVSEDTKKCLEKNNTSSTISKSFATLSTQQKPLVVTSSTTQNQNTSHYDKQDVDYVFFLDEQGTIVNCSDDIFKELGYQKDELIHKHLSIIDIIDDKKTLKNLINNSKKQGSICIKSIHKQKNGSKNLVTADITYIKNENLFRCNVKKDLC
jgi:PAS domain S-box-containing protein